MVSNFKKRLQSGEKLWGTMITLASPSTAEILAGVGFDWFFIDGEHGPLGVTEIQSILQTVSHRVTCLVRVPEASEVAIKKVLDVGAHGIIVPQVNSAEVAKKVVSWSKYSPHGARGVGLARAHGYGQSFTEYIASANEELLVLVQAEHKLALENIEEMVQVKGLDAIQLGPYDLSASMDQMGQIDSPDVVSAIETVCSACKKVNLPIASFGITPAAVQNDISRGATLICAGTDTLFLNSGASQMLKSVSSA